MTANTKLTSVSAARPVNPPGTSIVLTEAQLWAGINIKLRHIDKFAPDIVAHCELIEDTGNQIVRKITFPGENPTVVNEPCTFWPRVAARGWYPNGGTVTDAITYGPNDELWFTITCTGMIPESIPVEGLSAKEIARKVGDVIETALVKIRELVRDGTIKA